MQSVQRWWTVMSTPSLPAAFGSSRPVSVMLVLVALVPELVPADEHMPCLVVVLTPGY